MAISYLKNSEFAKSLSILGGVHWVAKTFFRARGYRYEVRRTGEQRLVYWKKNLRKKNSKDPYPKRFVLIPGFGDTPLSWYIVLVLLQPILKKNFDEVILFDFPGFGGFLAKDKCIATMDLLLKAVSDVLDSLKPHTIMGHSLGGWLTAYYAGECGIGQRPMTNKLNYSGPASIILANPSGVFNSAEERNEWEALFRNCMKVGFSGLRPHLFAKEPPWFRLVMSHFASFLTREDILQFMDSFSEKHLVESSAAHIQSDVWLVWGEKDTLIPSKNAEAWLRFLNPNRKAHHRAIFIKDAGHSPHLEKPAVTAALLGQILSQMEPHRLGRRWWTMPQFDQKLAP